MDIPPNVLLSKTGPNVARKLARVPIKIAGEAIKECPTGVQTWGKTMAVKRISVYVFVRDRILLLMRDFFPPITCFLLFFGISFSMDTIDRKILAELQKDGRLTLTELSDRIGLSLSPCHRRVRAMEEAGVISGYRVTINPKAVGLNFSALVFVTLRTTDRDSVQSFEKAVPLIPEVIQAQRMRPAKSSTQPRKAKTWCALKFKWAPVLAF